jgi:hypothetical protein
MRNELEISIDFRRAFQSRGDFGELHVTLSSSFIMNISGKFHSKMHETRKDDEIRPLCSAHKTCNSSHFFKATNGKLPNLI